MLFRQLSRLLDDGHTKVGEAAFALGISVQRANYLLRRGRVTRAQLRDRRKDYIVDKLAGPSSKAYRHTPHVIGRYFNVDESYVRQLIRELRAEGRLPPTDNSNEDYQNDLLQMLRRRFPNVYRGWVVGRKDDMVFVAGKGWLNWQQVEDLAHSP